MFDAITADGVCKYLKKGQVCSVEPDVMEQVGSTNDEVKLRAVCGAAEGLLVVSGKQTSGRGRMGRAFFSPRDTGVYMSLLLRPCIKPEDAVQITTAAAVSVCEALEQLGCDNTSIKWVNDVFVNNKKVCGILTESSFDAENNTLEYAVLGVGLNVYEPVGDFPAEIKDIAGNVFSEPKEDLRNKFIAFFLNSFLEYYKDLPLRKHCSEYRRRCFVIGKEVQLISGGEPRLCKVLDVDESCRLLVQYGNGEKAVVNSGEISLRTITG